MLKIIRLRPREDLVGKDERFTLRTPSFEGSYTDTLAKLAESQRLIVAEESTEGNFVIPGLEAHPMKVHSSWVLDSADVYSTFDEVLSDLNPEE